MAFDNQENAEVYTPEEGDTLHSIAVQESEKGNLLSWKDIALFNWGTDDEVEVNNFLRDEFKTYKRDENNNFIFSRDDENVAKFNIPVRFARKGLRLKQTYTLRLKRNSVPSQFLECCHVPSITFGFNSSFICPNVIGYLKKLELASSRHPNGKIMVFGHADAVGDDLYNKKLSERRAWSVYAFITNDADAWETLYNHPDEDWGLIVIQQILTNLGCGPGPVDGIWGSLTRDAIRRFRHLPDGADVKNDSVFRKKLFLQYMSEVHDIKLDASRFMHPAYMGCGEYNPIENIETLSESNRRVTFFLFNEQRLPQLPCKYADCSPCRQQMASPEYRHKNTFRCSFYDSLAKNCGSDNPVIADWISFCLLNKDDNHPVTDARYTLELPDGRVIEGQLDDMGSAKIDDAASGMCTLRFHDYHAKDWDADEDKELSYINEDEDEDEETEDIEIKTAGVGDSPFLDDDPDNESNEEDIQEP